MASLGATICLYMHSVEIGHSKFINGMESILDHSFEMCFISNYVAKYLLL